MNVLIYHDVSKVKDLSFMGYNIWTMVEWENAFITNKVKVAAIFPTFYIYVYSSEGCKIDQSIFQSIKEIHSDAVIHFTTMEEHQVIRDRLVSKGERFVQLESSILLPIPIVRDKMRNYPPTKKNIWLPVAHYKYGYKEVEWKNNKYTVKTFIPSKQSLYNNSDIELDWDERYYITHALFGKLNGALPIMSPSPLFHNWGQTLKVVINNNYEDQFSDQYDIALSHCSSFIAKFERV